MATEVARHAVEDSASADLTALGMRLEILRIQKGLSKQGLARSAGTSRQQLWRVMTGKSELTTALKVRLAGALACETEVIADHSDHTATALDGRSPARPMTVSDYLTDANHIATTLKTLPLCDEGQRLKRALLNTLEDMAVEAGRTLPADYPEIHRQVLAGEL
ncbi:hypothetical protein BH09GEM1_BH09GEM1_03760 [soil metagenome]